MGSCAEPVCRSQSTDIGRFTPSSARVMGHPSHGFGTRRCFKDTSFSPWCLVGNEGVSCCRDYHRDYVGLLWMILAVTHGSYILFLRPKERRITARFVGSSCFRGLLCPQHMNRRSKLSRPEVQFTADDTTCAAT